MSIIPTWNTYPGAFLILTGNPSNVAFDSNFLKSFHPADQRKAAWTKSITVSGKTFYYPYKYKVRQNATRISEYTMVLRLSEQYLIRAEARARQNNLNGALSDINTIRLRAGLSSLPGITQQALLDSIGRERRWELFTEFSDRWIDLRRTGKADIIMSLTKGTNWNTTDQLYPIPQMEINRNSNLVQNPGY